MLNLHIHSLHQLIIKTMPTMFINHHQLLLLHIRHLMYSMLTQFCINQCYMYQLDNLRYIKRILY